MNYGQSFRLALKSLATSKMRSLLTMLGIIIGVASVIIILALGNGVQGMIDEQVDKLGINMIQTIIYGRGDGSTTDLDPEDMYQLVEEHPALLTGVSPYVGFQATLRHGDDKFEDTQLYGVSQVMFNNSTQATIDGDRSCPRGAFSPIWTWSAGRTCASSGPIWPRRPSGAANRPWDRPCPSTVPPIPWWAFWSG